MDKVVHFEIPMDDPERAIEFYKEIFGWEITKAPGEGVDYWLVKTVETDENQMPKEAGAINGGMMRRQMEDTPVIVVSVSDLDDYLDKVKDAGGKVVMEKQKVMDMGLYARVMDTEGNVIGLWQNLM